MIKWIGNMLQSKRKEGGIVTFFSTGRPFNPTFQERTTAVDDLIRQANRSRPKKRQDR